MNQPFLLRCSMMNEHLRSITPVLPLEMRLANRINQEREAHGLHRLGYDWQLAAVARAHSAEMAALGYFEHESPTPGLREPWDRYRRSFNREPFFISENLSRSVGGDYRPLSFERAEKAHHGLMDSPGHRANILDWKPLHMGVGVFANSNGDVWITELFVRHF